MRNFVSFQDKIWGEEDCRPSDPILSIYEAERVCRLCWFEKLN